MRYAATFLVFVATLNALAVSAEAQTYTYDGAGRLVRAAYANGSGVVYSYDDGDNLVSVSPLNLPPAPVRVSAVRSTPGQVRLNWEPIAGATSGYVIFRKSTASGSWTEVATVSSGLSFIDAVPNLAGDYVYRIAALGGGGLSAQSRDIHPSSPEAPEAYIEGGGARQFLSAGANPTVRAGYARVNVETGNSPYGIVVFRTTQNGVVVSEAGVPAIPPTTRTRLFVDYRNTLEATIQTGVAMVNPGTKPARLTFRLRRTDGSLVTSGTGTLAPGSHVARFVDDFSAIALGFVIPADFPSAIGFGTLDVESDQPVSTVALRMTVNRRGEFLFTSTPVADLNAPAANGPLYFPHFADGGNYRTAVVLINAGALQQNGTIEFLGTGGSPHVITTTGGQTGSSFAYSISPGGAFILESRGAGSTAQGGSIRVTPAANSDVPFGSGLFRLIQEGIVISESGIPAAALTTSARLYVDQNGGHDTGLALANPSNSASSITVRAFSLDGSTSQGQAPLSVAARGQRAAFVRELISGLPAGFTGVVDITSTTPFALLAVRLLTNTRGESLMTTFPTADLTRPAPAPVIFPQIADGGGYQSELILISPHAPMSGVVRYFDSNGTPFQGAQIPGP